MHARKSTQRMQISDKAAHYSNITQICDLESSMVIQIISKI